MEIEAFKSQVSYWIERFRDNINIGREEFNRILEEKMIIKKGEPDLRERVHNAHQEWMNAMNYFDNVTDPDLIDHASFLMGAARSKYLFYLKQLKNGD
ncbi:MAG TPA: DUF2508 family protein [Halanaerobiales bacterium]|nr:DUF2508 family protein [Halanaerobiales bacterium]